MLFELICDIISSTATTIAKCNRTIINLTKCNRTIINHNVLSYKPQIYPLEHFSLFPRECREQARNSTRNNLCTEQSNLAKGQI
ncbi:hypothetical protein QQG55_53710 [Brugia pahangi]